MREELEIRRGPTAVEIFASPEVIVQEETQPLKEQVAELSEAVRVLQERTRALEQRWMVLWRTDGYAQKMEPAGSGDVAAGLSARPSRYTD